jgi:hypothetical protein
MGFILHKDKSELFDNLPAISIWKMAASLLLRSGFFDEQFKKNIPGTEKVIDTALTYVNHTDRLNFLYKTVQNRVPFSEGQTAYPDDITDTWKKRKGSSAEINMLLMNLLKRSNIECHPLFISTRGHGKINTDFPSFGQFNGIDVLVKINNVNYIVDASIRHTSYKTPPQNILNRRAFLIDHDNLQWVMITDERPLLKQNADFFLLLKDDGKIEGGTTITQYDYAKSATLDSSQHDAENKPETLFNKNLPGIILLSEKTENSETDSPLIQTIEFDYEIQNSGDYFLINPNMFSSKKFNYFKQEFRNTDIDFGSNQEIRTSLELEIPLQFLIEKLPKSIVIRSPDSSFVFTRMVSNSKSTISYSHIIEIKKATFDKNEYTGLVQFFDQVQKAIAEDIIIKKVK